MDVDKKEIERRERRIISKLYDIKDVVGEEGLTVVEKVEIKEMIDDCIDAFRLLLIDMTTE